MSVACNGRLGFVQLRLTASHCSRLAQASLCERTPSFGAYPFIAVASEVAEIHLGIDLGPLCATLNMTWKAFSVSISWSNSIKLLTIELKVSFQEVFVKPPWVVFLISPTFLTEASELIYEVSRRSFPLSELVVYACRGYKRWKVLLTNGCSFRSIRSLFSIQLK